MGNAIITSRSNSNSSSSSDAIGDIKFSCRTDLGDKYLLCNGDCIYSDEGYSDLIDVLQSCDSDNYFAEFSISDRSDIKYAMSTESSKIYEFYKSSSGKDSYIHLRVYDDYKKFINDDASVDKIIITHSNSAYPKALTPYSAKIFNNQISLLYTKRLSSTTYIYASIDIDTLTVTESIFSTSYGPIRIGYDNNLLVAAHIDSNNRNIIYRTSSDGIIFTDSATASSNSTSKELSSVCITDDKIIMQCPYTGSNKMVFVYNDLQMSSSWKTSDTCVAYNTPTPLIYYNGYYFYHTPNGDGGGATYKSSDLESWTDEYSYRSSVGTCHAIFIIRNSKLFYINDQLTTVRIYDIDTNSFLEASTTILRENNILPHDIMDIKISKKGVYIDNYETSEMCLYDNECIVLKHDKCSKLPNISSTSYEYAYIKAKE